MPGTAFITGVTGQDGAYLCRLLLEKGYRVHGGVRRSGVINTGRLDALGISGDVTLHDFELLEDSNIMRVLDRIAPDEVYNLAAQSFVGVSFEQPLYTSNADALGPLRLLEAIRARGGRSRFYQASTSEMYGRTAAGVPQDETTPFRPRSPYGAAKAFAHYCTVNYRDGFGLHASSGILFNHESPLRGKEFVTRKITLGLARIKADLQMVLELGNLDAERDWGHAADYCEGIWMMLQQERADDYVLATGVARSVRAFVEQAARCCGWEIAWRGSGVDETGHDRQSGRLLVRINPDFHRPTDVDRLIGDASKAARVLGWRPRTSFDQLVEMMTESDIRRVTQGVIAF